MGNKKKINLLFFGLLVVAIFFISLTYIFNIRLGDYLPATLRPSSRPDDFVLSQLTLKCNGSALPEISLVWSVSNKATSYTVQRKIGSARKWETVGQTKELVFVDNTWGIGYPAGQTAYQIKAANNYATKLSNIQYIDVPNCSVVPNPEPTPVPGTTGMQWGAYVGWRTTDMASFESQVGKKVNYQALFIHWGNESDFPSNFVATIKNQGKTMIIFWEAMDYNVSSTEQPRFSYDSILKGTWDSYFISFAAAAKTYGGPVILIPFEEMNGDWYPWSGTKNTNTPAKHIQTYRYVKNFFNNIPNVKMAWVINADSVPDTEANKIEAYYPGSDYVDYIGVNGFNFNDPWMTFSQVFDNALARVKVYNKPVIITSLACASGTKKAAWITDALTVQIPKHPEIVGWDWFNENKEEDWRVWSDANSLKAFQTALP